MNIPSNDILIHLKSQIGFEQSFTSPDPLSSGTIRQYCEAIGDYNPVYFDPVFAKAVGYDGLIAPPSLICESEQFSGYCEVNPILSGSYYFREHWYSWLRAGNNYEFYRPANIGDLISTEKCLEDVWLKIGSKGTHIFRKILIIYKNQCGVTLAKNEEIMFLTVPSIA
jgi:hypothetical protein